jgi:two-component system, response regulator PdtaR
MSIACLMLVRRHTMTGLRIAIADDSGDQRRMLGSLLRALGHDVICEAADGKELVEAVLQTHVDLVITDLEMPVLDGLQAAEQIAQKCPVPIILQSGHPDAEHVVIEHEPVALRLHKPVSADTLQRAIKEATAVSQASVQR